MDLFVYLIQWTALALLDVLEIAFLLRAVLSWIPMEENAFSEIMYRITEPFVMPFRALFHKLNLFQTLPIDMSFLFAVIVLAILRTFIASL